MLKTCDIMRTYKVRSIMYIEHYKGVLRYEDERHVCYVYLGKRYIGLIQIGFGVPFKVPLKIKNH